MTTALPQAVQRQVEAADQLQKDLYAQPEAEPSVSPGAEQVESEEVQPGEDTAQTPKPETQAPTQPQATDKPKEQDIDYWKGRFYSLQGMYNSQLPQLQNENAQLRAQIQTIAAQLAEAKKAPQPQESPASKSVTDKDREAFGQDLIDLQERVARDAVAQARAEVRAELEQRDQKIAEMAAKMGQVSERQVANETDKFFNVLTAKLPDWEVVNADPAFIQWLGKVDRKSGIRLQAMLDDASQSGDVDRVVSIFEDFKATLPAPAAAPQEQRRPADDLQRQVTPSKARATASPTQVQDWTGAEYTRVYDRRYEKEVGPAKAAEMRAEADRAVQEGRVAW